MAKSIMPSKKGAKRALNLLIKRFTPLLVMYIAVKCFNSQNIATSNVLYQISSSLRSWFESLWERIYETFGRNDFVVHNVGSWLVGVGFYLGCNTVFLFCDVTGKPKWMLKYKVQDGTNNPVDMHKLLVLLKTTIFNITIVTPIFTVLFYPIVKYFGAYHTKELPTFDRFLGELMAFMILIEIGFYYTHRLLHHPKLYARLHKKHHEWTAPIGAESIYCGVPEMIISNLVPAAIGPLVMRSHLMVSWIWFGMVLFGTTVVHSGYHMPFLDSPEAHDYHHKVFNKQFGTIGILDVLHGTDFEGTVEEERHFIVYSFKPVKDLVPDKKKSC